MIQRLLLVLTAVWACSSVCANTSAGEIDLSSYNPEYRIFLGYHGLGFSQDGKTEVEKVEDHKACKLQALGADTESIRDMFNMTKLCMAIKGYSCDSGVLKSKEEELKSKPIKDNLDNYPW